MTTTRTLTAWSVTAAAVLLMVPCGHGQSGPAPGQDPVGYTASYAQDQATQATSDPVTYAQQKGSVEGASAEAAHTAWLACWAAWEKTGQLLPGCEAYFTPPQKAPRPSAGGNGEENGTAQDVQDTAAEVQNQTAQVVDAVTAALNGTVADPASAPSQIQMVLGAIGNFAGWLAGRLLDAAGSVLGGLGIGIVAIGQALGLAAKAVAIGFNAGIAGIVTGAQASVTGIVAAVQELGSGLSVAAGSVGQGIGASAGAIAQALAISGKFLAQLSVGVAQATMAGVNATVAAAHAVAGGVASGFGAAVKAIADVSGATVHGIVAGVQATGAGIAAAADGVSKAAQATGKAIADAAGAVGNAIGSAVHAIADAVGSLFHGHAPAAQTAAPTGRVGADLPKVDANGLLDQVTDKLPS
jgi:hypothetical protein